MSDLLGVEQGTAGHLGPKIIIWNQFVIHQAVNTVRLHNGALVQLVFIWRPCSYKNKDISSRFMACFFKGLRQT